MVLKKFIEYSLTVKPRLTMCVWLLNTGHFTVWGNLTKAAVNVVCVGKFN